MVRDSRKTSVSSIRRTAFHFTIRSNASFRLLSTEDAVVPRSPALKVYKGTRKCSATEIRLMVSYVARAGTEPKGNKKEL